MEVRTKSTTWKYLAVWAATVFVVIVASTFLHEIGHGIGAKIDGIHVSTGFNKVGMPGKTPADPDFRADMPEGIWFGLLGPMTTWALAIGFTIALYGLKKATRLSFVMGALAVANGLIRAVPMTIFLLSALAGRLHMEDEVGWGIWMVTNVLSPRRLAHWGGRAAVIALALIAEFAQIPVINALDRVIRINW